MHIEPGFNAEMFLQVYKNVYEGRITHPRGSVCKEVTDAMFPLSLALSPLTSFRARNLNLNYAKEEFKWYLRADKFDQSIEKHASIWQKIRQPDGSYYSNYGQYIFPSQFFFVVNELLYDPWSRRASIVLLKADHLYHENTDVVCTYSMNFRLRDGMLHMSVNMRSNDVIFGTTNDVFCFVMVYRMIYALMRDTLPKLKPGLYMHKVDSLHVYERHFAMIAQIISEGMGGYEEIMVPWPRSDEVRQTLRYGLQEDRGLWSSWLRT